MMRDFSTQAPANAAMPLLCDFLCASVMMVAMSIGSCSLTSSSRRLLPRRRRCQEGQPLTKAFPRLADRGSILTERTEEKYIGVGKPIYRASRPSTYTPALAACLAAYFITEAQTFGGLEPLYRCPLLEASIVSIRVGLGTTLTQVLDFVLSCYTFCALTLSPWRD